MKHSLPCLILLLSGLIMSGCSKDQSEPQQAAQVTQAPKAAVVSPGEQLFKQNCKVCHAQGINGAPIVGNNKMWSGRIEKGIPLLVEHASNGFGLMPAKGGNENLTQEDITLIVTYMVSQVTE